MKAQILSAFGTFALFAGLSLPASAEGVAKTPVLPEETITGVEFFELAPPPVGPRYFTLPMDIRIVKDASVTTNTPITDQYGKDLPKWGEMISACLKDKPVLQRVVGEQAVPFVLKDGEGKIKLNANDKPVCPV
jgi:hypothetical protein